MPRNASGSYTLPSGNPVVSGTLIDATWANNTLADLGNEVTDSLSRSGEGAMLAPLRITDGVQATPSLAFSNEPSSGLYRAGSNEWWAVAAGVQNLRFTNTGLTTRAAAGAVGTPSIAAFNDTDTGIYFPGANELAIATGGALRLSVDSAGTISIPGSFGVDTNTLYVDAPNNRVGIGTSSPAYKLDVDGAARVNNLLWFTPTSGSLGIGASGTNFEIYNGPGAETRFVVSNAGDVGIGTASPAQKLDVLVAPAAAAAAGMQVRTASISAQLAITGATYNNYGVGANTVWLFSDTSNLALGPYGGTGSVQFVTGGSLRATLDQSGNLGLGVTPSAFSSGYIALQFGGNPVIASQNNLALAGNAYYNSGWKYIASNFASRYDSNFNNGGIHAWFNAPSGTAGNAISFTQAMTLDASGNLGVGTTSPSFASGIGVVVYNSGGAARFAMKNNDTGNASGDGFQLAVSGPDAYIEQRENANLIFSTNNTERARFTAGGYFKASNNGSYVGSTANYHEFNTNAGDWVAVARNFASSSAYGIYVHYSASTPNGTGNEFLYCADNTTPRATIRSNGGLANYQANDVNLSDERVKTDIAPLGSMWGKIKALEIVTFKYRDQTHDDYNIGVIAQQVEAVAPEFVDADGFGKTPEDGVPLKTIYTADMYHAAIKALQEAMSRIESLEAKVSALEAK